MGFSQLITGMREQGLDQLLGVDITASPSEVSLALGVSERAEATKTVANQGVVIYDKSLQKFFRQKKEVLEDHERVFPIHIDTYRRHYREGCRHHGLLEEGPHVWRHTFAVHAMHYWGWSRPRTRDYGRWARDESLQNYGHVHLLAWNEARLTKEQVERGN